jgi:hypothetical protein
VPLVLNWWCEQEFLGMCQDQIAFELLELLQRHMSGLDPDIHSALMVGLGSPCRRTDLPPVEIFVRESLFPIVAEKILARSLEAAHLVPSFDDAKMTVRLILNDSR